jgi:hypothetical protein
LNGLRRDAAATVEEHDPRHIGVSESCGPWGGWNPRMMGLELDEAKHATALGCNPHLGDELAWRAGVLRRNSDELCWFRLVYNCCLFK